MDTVKQVEGTCLCGKVQFLIENPVAASAHCHCHYCKLSSGAAFVTWVVVPDNKFKVKSGESLLKWYQSSEYSKRGFCQNCGSSVLFRSELCPGEIHITRVNLKESVQPLPQFNCFFDQSVDWISLDTSQLKMLSSDSEEIRHYQKIPPPAVV